MKFTKAFATLVFFCILFLDVKGQINYEYTYPGPNLPSSVRLQLLDLGNSEFKYVYVDYSTNQLKLFNLNHSPYATITVPVTLMNDGEYVITYVTRSMFDCDTAKFEYAVIPPTNINNGFYVYREDGTLLFQEDSVLAPYCFGCFNGAYDVRPIVNTPAGAKLFLLKADSNASFLTTMVYGLCGELPDHIMTNDAAVASFVKIAPNPSQGAVQFMFDLPGNAQNYELVVYNAAGQSMHSTAIQGTAKNYQLQLRTFNSGLYFYTLKTDKTIIQNGKFIITQ